MINITPTGAWNYNESLYNENHYLDEGVAEYLAKLIGNDGTLLDFGCGAGYYLKYIQDKSNNLEILGVEPYAQNHHDLKTNHIVSRDLTVDFDLGKRGHLMCIEVLEHIPSKLEGNAVENIIRHCNGYLIISWAKIGQGGHGHINCKNQVDVIALFESKGYSFLEKESLEIRKVAHLWWLQNNLCIFKYRE
jgi:tryptophanyl-tRNA synthetase